MKKSLIFVILALIVSVATPAKAVLPVTFQEFKDRYQTEGRTMDGAAHLYFEAVFCYMNEATRPEASKMLRYAMYQPNSEIEKSQNYGTFMSRLKDPAYHYIFRSFVAGTSPENSYSMNPDNFRLNIVSSRAESDFHRLYLKSTGADSDRNIWMRQHDGLWYVINNASTYAQVREPKQASDARKSAHDADHDQPAATPGNAGQASGQGAAPKGGTAGEANSGDPMPKLW